MNKTLVLLTASFPYGNSETFLETEINYLCQGFERVVIVSCDVTSTEKRLVPDNCEVQRLTIKHTKKLQIKSLINLLHPVYSNEKQIIKNVYQKKQTNAMTKTMLVSLERAKRVANYLQRQHFDYDSTVFYSYWCDDTSLGLALLKNGNSKVKAVSRAHGWDVYFNVHAINYLPFRQFIAKMIAVFPISVQGKNTIENVWKYNGSVQVARLGVKLQNNENRVRSSIFSVVSCSNLIPLKRVDLLAQALKFLSSTPIKWTHFGGGVDRDKVMTIIAEFPNNIQVDFKGRVPNKEIFQFYQENCPHLFVNVSSSEGVPVSIMEAMSFGIPVLATNVGGNGEIVISTGLITDSISSITDNGYLLPENPTPKEIADQIKRFITMSDEVFQLYSDNAYHTWKEHYNAEKNYGEFVALLKDL